MCPVCAHTSSSNKGPKTKKLKTSGATNSSPVVNVSKFVLSWENWKIQLTRKEHRTESSKWLCRVRVCIRMSSYGSSCVHKNLLSLKTWCEAPLEVMNFYWWLLILVLDFFFFFLACNSFSCNFHVPHVFNCVWQLTSITLRWFCAVDRMLRSSYFLNHGGCTWRAGMQIFRKIDRILDCKIQSILDCKIQRIKSMCISLSCEK